MTIVYDMANLFLEITGLEGITIRTSKKPQLLDSGHKSPVPLPTLHQTINDPYQVFKKTTEMPATVNL